MSPDWSPAILERALSQAAVPTSDFELNPEVVPPDIDLRPAGVLAAFHQADGRLILTKRASGLRHHPGQISLPGGKVDPGDHDEIGAALREAQEEIGLAPSRVTVIGRLPAHRTVTGFAITPVLALIDGRFDPLPEPGEVDEVFALPFAHISNSDNYRVEGRFWRGSFRRYYTAPYGPYYLWGATARIFLSLARRMTA